MSGATRVIGKRLFGLFSDFSESNGDFRVGIIVIVSVRIREV